MIRRLVVPAVLVVAPLAIGGCSTTMNPDVTVGDAMDAPMDAAVDTAIDAQEADSVPCGPVIQADGAVACVGGAGEVFCVGPVGNCTVVAGDASASCCELAA